MSDKNTRPTRGSGPPGKRRRYRHPVPEPAAILSAMEESGVPMEFGALAAVLGVVQRAHQVQLRSRLSDLVTAGRLLVNRRQEYCLTSRLGIVTGVVSAHRDGFGFLIADDGAEDVYLPPAEMRQLLDGDRIAIRVTGRGPRERRAGVVVEIIERGKRHAVGRYQREHGVGFVVESGRSRAQFIVPEAHRHGAQPGQFVKIEIISYPGPGREAQGKVLRLLGSPEDDPAVATEAALEIFGLPVVWPADARRAAAALGGEVRETDKRDRRDLRDLPLVTIDGADARDFDDAVYAEPRDNGWRLVVAIADVSHYVHDGDAIDIEAGKRCTSAYFPDRVVPMLPEQLSNGLCSLRPNVDRLCMVCEMNVDAGGEVRRSDFYRAVMRSRQRLIYEDVQAAYDGQSAARRKLRGVLDQVGHLYGVYAALARQRQRRGALDLELPETRIVLGEDGRVASIGLRARTDAHRLIEECMIAANVQAARFLRLHRLATLFRVHAGPDEEKFENLRVMLQALGVAVGERPRGPNPRELNRVLCRLRERPDYAVLATAVLRTMAQAVYQPANIGHFGLSLGAYVHFTSPIRRYPDLIVHRGIGHVLDKGRPGDFPYDIVRMEALGHRTSERERRVDEAARHVEARYKCAWVRDRVGEVFAGVVTGVTHFGLFVTLKDFNVDGLVHVTTLGNDYYQLQHGGARLVGMRTGRNYGLGDPVHARIVRVEVDDARIDLSLDDGRSAVTSGMGSAVRRRGRGRR